MKKREIQALLDEILEARNGADAYHAYLANQIEDLRAQLNEIQRRLPPECLDWRTYEIMPDGTRRECAE